MFLFPSSHEIEQIDITYNVIEILLNSLQPQINTYLQCQIIRHKRMPESSSLQSSRHYAYLLIDLATFHVLLKYVEIHRFCRIF